MGTKVGYPAPAREMTELDKLIAFLRQDAHANNGKYLPHLAISEERFATVWGQLCLAARNLAMPHAYETPLPDEFMLCGVKIRVQKPLVAPGINTVWRHRYHGFVYKVVDRVRYEPTNEDGVVYTLTFIVASESLDGIHWVRPLSEWHRDFEEVNV